MLSYRSLLIGVHLLSFIELLLNLHIRLVMNWLSVVRLLMLFRLCTCVRQNTSTSILIFLRIHVFFVSFTIFICYAFQTI